MHKKIEILRFAELSPATLPQKIQSLTNEIEIYEYYYRHQFYLRGDYCASRDTLSIAPSLNFKSIDQTELSYSSKERESLNFYLNIFKYLSAAIFLRGRQIFLMRKLKQAGFPSNILQTYGAIAQATDVFNIFILNISLVECIKRDFSATDLSALYIQLADEFIDNVKTKLPPRKCIELLKKHWVSVFGEPGEMPFPRGMETIFDTNSINLNAIPTKYNISCAEILKLIQDLSDLIESKVTNKPYKTKFIEKFRLSIEQAFSTFLEELIYCEKGIENLKLSPEIVEHFERKTVSVLAAWLELRIVNASLSINDFSPIIKKWSRLFIDFQIFDDLKDIKQDYNNQPNLLQMVSKIYDNESKWLQDNVNKFTPDGDLITTLHINLNMPLSIMHLKLIAHEHANKHFSPFLKAIQNFRWKKSWLSSHFSFQQKSSPLHIDSIFKINTDQGKLPSIIAFVLTKIYPILDRTNNFDIYAAHCIDIIGIDDRNFIYKNSTFSQFWACLVFAPSMPIRKKGEILKRIIENTKSMGFIVQTIQTTHGYKAGGKFLDSLKNDY